LDQSLERGVHFLDTAEMYPVPPSAATYTETERIIGRYFQARPDVRQRWIVATKVAGPSRAMPWIREGRSVVSEQDIVTACESSLKRLHTDYIDLYQLHWPSRSLPVFGGLYFEPNSHETPTVVREAMEVQLAALNSLVKAGKVRAIGLSNETPFGLHAFVNLAKEMGTAPIASVQNPYCLTNRSYENGLDESCHHLNVAMLAYSPLAFGVLTGKYDEMGFVSADVSAQQPSLMKGRMDRYARMQAQRWARPEALFAAKRYNQLARDHGLSPTQMALAFCYQKSSITSTIMGCTSATQMHECYDALSVNLSPDLLREIDALRLTMRDPAQ
jgi:aryl-alcohol dehydrogenase-like predicted oxidoreductase